MAVKHAVVERKYSGSDAVSRDNRTRLLKGADDANRIKSMNRVRGGHGDRRQAYVEMK
jgi:hypothetical protein